MIDKALQTTTGRIYSMRASRGSLELSETNRICNSFGTLTVCQSTSFTPCPRNPKESGCSGNRKNK